MNTVKKGFPPIETALFTLMLVSLIFVLLDVSNAPKASVFKTATTVANDGVPFERYCGYLEKVARGQINFENEEPIHIAYLYFKERDGESPLVTRAIYERQEILEKIKPHQYYSVAVRKYGEGLNFPRRLKVVESCE